MRYTRICFLEPPTIYCGLGVGFSVGVPTRIGVCVSFGVGVGFGFGYVFGFSFSVEVPTRCSVFDVIIIDPTFVALCDMKCTGILGARMDAHVLSAVSTLHRIIF